MAERRVRKERRGLVISNRMQNTVVVSIGRTVMHPKYRKYLKLQSHVKAHDEKNECQIGDRVSIVECRPLSREKRWRVRRILERAAQAEGDAGARG
jgi:small subunit ribosomal protein S17